MPAASRDNLLGKQKADSLPDPSDGVRTFSAFGVGKTTCTSQPKMELIDDLPAPYDGQPVIANLEESFEDGPTFEVKKRKEFKEHSFVSLTIM